MGSFELRIPKAEQAAAKKAAAAAGCRLLHDEGDSFVLMGAAVPPSLEKFAEGAAPKKEAKRSRPEKSKRFALDVPFDGRSYARALGAQWHGERKCWFYEGPNLPIGLAPFEAESFSWEWLQERSEAGEPFGAFKGEGVPFEPKPHQLAAASAVAQVGAGKGRGFLLADEVGLGKTISAWLSAQAICERSGSESVLVVCPLSVAAHWRQTIKRMGSRVGKILVINYDRLGKLFDSESSTKSLKGLAKKGKAQAWDLVIFDESHKLKNPTAARSKFAAKLAASSKFCIWMSATAGQTPLELSYLAPLLASATGSSAASMKDFEAWCKAQGYGVKQGKFGAWEWDGSREDCEKLSKLLFGGPVPRGLRRLPQDIEGWPEISRQLTPQTLDAQERALYLACWEDFKKAMRSSEFAAGVKKTMAGPSKGKGAGALVEVLRFRQKSSQLRVGATTDLACDILEEGRKPAISCAFKTSAEAIKKALEKKGHRCAVIHGGLDAKEREAQRLAFQSGKANAIVFTVEEGISLHEGEHEEVPRTLLIHDLRWSAIQMAQIEGRTHRNGKFALAMWLVGEGTVEAKIAERVAKRAAAMKALSGDEDSGLEKEILAELWKLGQEGS